MAAIARRFAIAAALRHDIMNLIEVVLLVCIVHLAPETFLCVLQFIAKVFMIILLVNWGAIDTSVDLSELHR
jgi:hypothetical protein